MVRLSCHCQTSLLSLWMIGITFILDRLGTGGGLVMAPDEVLLEILLPLVGAHSTVVFLKPHGSLKDDSTLSVACAARNSNPSGAGLEGPQSTVRSCRIVFGGLQSFLEVPQASAALCCTNGRGPAAAAVV